MFNPSPQIDEQRALTLEGDPNTKAPENALAIDPEIEEQVKQKWQQIRCYGFECCQFKFIAPLNIYCELLPQPLITAMPNAPDHLLGLCNVRGNLVPAYQLEVVLAKPAIAPRYALVIGKLEQAAALIIAAKPKPFDLQRFSQCDVPEDLPELLHSAVTNAYQLDGETWLLLNHGALFNALARERGISFK